MKRSQANEKKERKTKGKQKENKRKTKGKQKKNITHINNQNVFQTIASYTRPEDTAKLDLVHPLIKKDNEKTWKDHMERLGLAKSHIAKGGQHRATYISKRKNAIYSRKNLPSTSMRLMLEYANLEKNKKSTQDHPILEITLAADTFKQSFARPDHLNDYLRYNTHYQIGRAHV